MRVALSLPADPRRAAASGAPQTGRPLLDRGGPAVVVGSRAGDGALPEPVAPRPDTLFGPRGACLGGPDGPLIVADTGHHRLLIWHRLPAADQAPADWVIGQKSFRHEGRNARGEAGAATLNVPTGVAAENGVLAVADAWNHRVLVWRSYPADHNVPADVVLGQNGFAGTAANRGGRPGADTLNWCYGVALIDGRLVVADTGNRRVLVWREVPGENGQPADLVIGQDRFDGRDENAGRAPDAAGMRWPHAVCRLGARLAVADAGNNRVMVWNAPPDANGRPCDFVLGQSDAAGVDHNGGGYWPDARVLNMPYGLAALGDTLAVADTANSRLLGWPAADLAPGAAATRLTGQPDFAAKGDNRWLPATRDSLCWPYALTARGTDEGDLAVVADTGNNRVSIWRAAP